MKASVRHLEVTVADLKLDRGLVRITTLTRLELGATRPAVDVQLLLADRGQHRTRSISNLMLAATAEPAGLIVLHFEKDFDLITEVTRQQVERLAADDELP